VGDETRFRTALHDTIQTAGPGTDELPAGALLIGWVLVADWMSPDGDRWLSRECGGATRDRLPGWQERGYLHEALFHGDDFDGAPGDPDPEPEGGQA
jgi:hypothetical protein